MATQRDKVVAMVAEWRRLGIPGLPADAVLVDMILADMRAQASWRYRFACAQWFTYSALAAVMLALVVATVCVIAGRA